MNHLTYHKATIDDISTLVENRILFALELSGEQKEETIQAVRKQMTAYFLKAIAENSCISFIAKCDGLVAGLGSMHIREMPGHFKNPTGRWGYIMNMYTIPAFRRKGICKSILELLVDEGKKSGISAFELHATKEGEFVYSQSGFEVHSDRTYRKFTNKIS
jgi:predicted acetyltransferase